MKVSSLKDAITKFELSKADMVILADLFSDQKYQPTLRKLLEGLRLEAHTMGFKMSNNIETLQHFKGQDYAYKHIWDWLKKNHEENLKIERVTKK